jgi:hypothetical protein
VRQCIHLTLLVGDMYLSQHLCACASPSNPQFKRSSAISLRIRSLQEKGLVEDLPPTQPQPEPGSRIVVGLVIIIIIIIIQTTTINCQNSSPKTRLPRPADISGGSLNTKIRPAVCTPQVCTKLGGRIHVSLLRTSEVAPCKCLHPMPMSMSPVPDRVLRSRWASI